MTKSDIDALFAILKSIDSKLSMIVTGVPAGPPEIAEMYFLDGRREVRVPTMEAIKPGAKKRLKVAYFDANKRPAKVDGIPQWLGDAEQVVMTPAADGMSCDVEFKKDGKPGLGKIQAKADADMGAGVRELVAEYNYELTSDEAMFVEMTAEDIVEEAPAPAPVEEPAPAPVEEAPVPAPVEEPQA